MNTQSLDATANNLLNRVLKGGRLTRKEECYLNIFSQEDKILFRGEKRKIIPIPSLNLDAPEYVLTLLKPIFLKKNRGWRVRVHLNLYLNKRGFFERNEKFYRIEK